MFFHGCCLLSACGLGLYLSHDVVLRPSRDYKILLSSDHLGNARLFAESPLESDCNPCRTEVAGQARRVVALNSAVYPTQQHLLLAVLGPPSSHGGAAMQSPLY